MYEDKRLREKQNYAQNIWNNRYDLFKTISSEVKTDRELPLCLFDVIEEVIEIDFNNFDPVFTANFDILNPMRSEVPHPWFAFIHKVSFWSNQPISVAIHTGQKCYFEANVPRTAMWDYTDPLPYVHDFWWNNDIIQNKEGNNLPEYYTELKWLDGKGWGLQALKISNQAPLNMGLRFHGLVWKTLS